MQRELLILVLAATLLWGGCSVHRIDIQQGNYLDPELMEQIQPGLTKSQVRFILGDPVLTDLFHTDRWEYIYFLKSGETREITRRRIIVYFVGDTVASVVAEDDLG